MPSESAIVDLDLIEEYAKDALDLTIFFSKINTHNENSRGISDLIARILPLLEQLQFTIEVSDGRNIVARHSAKSPLGIVLLGHMDTAFKETDTFKDVWIDGSNLRGPGVSDMKGGIALLLCALRYLKQQGALIGKNIAILLNSDEEAGSYLSRDLIKKISVDYGLALIFEGGKRIDDVTTTYLNIRQGSSRRPPMIPSARAIYYSSLFESAAYDMNYNIMQKTRVGGSDGCFTSDAGVPTIDAIGPVGGEWHTDREYLEISSLRDRLELFVRFWQKLYT